MAARSIIARDRAALRRLIRQFHHRLVEIAPAPALRRIIALDNGMSRSMEMRRRMLSDGLVAAPDMAAFPAEPKMDPFLSVLQAFLAAKRPGLYGSNGCNMLTSRHLYLLWLWKSAPAGRKIDQETIFSIIRRCRTVSSSTSIRAETAPAMHAKLVSSASARKYCHVVTAVTIGNSRCLYFAPAGCCTYQPEKGRQAPLDGPSQFFSRWR